MRRNVKDMERGRRGRKLRILALHGYRQNGETFRAKTGAFRKAVGEFAELVYLSAPHGVPPSPDSESSSSERRDPRGWWFNGDDSTFKATRVGGPAVGFAESLRLVGETFERSGPFDGLFGFSQGACLAGVLAAMQQRGLLPFRSRFRFVVLAAGFRSGSLAHRGFYDEEIVLPSLHAFGETDQVIPKEMSESLAGLFSSPAVLEHGGGHLITCAGSLKRGYRDFLSDMAMAEAEADEDDEESQRSPSAGDSRLL